MKRLGLFCWILSFAGAVFAQAPAFQFPKIEDELVYAKDLGFRQEVEAVMTLDYGEVSFSVVGGRIRLYYTYYREIKILQEPGYRWATVEVPLGETEELFDVRGFTYSVLEETGKVQKLRMERKGVREELLPDGRRVKIFKLPLPREGSVLAYTYTVSSDDFVSLRPWDFQTSIPVLLSEYVTRIPDGFTYLTLFQGDASRLEQKSAAYPINMSLRITPSASGIPKVYASVHEEPEIRMVNETRYTMTQMPALEKEPFMGPEVDIVTRVQFKLSKLGQSRRSTYDILSNWSELGEGLMSHPDFGQRLAGAISWPADWQALIEGGNRNREHLFVLFEQIRSAVQWNGEYSLYAARPLGRVLQSGEGNGAELNLLLTALLQAAGYRAYPVLISTRSHGQSVPLFPELGQFNHVVTQVDLRGDRIFMDATQSLGPPDLIPLEHLAMEGLRVNARRSTWVNIESPYLRYRRTYARIFLKEDGTLDGRISQHDKGYSAVRTRELLNRAPDRNTFFREQMLGEFSRIQMGPTLVKGAELLSEPVLTRCEFETPDFVTRSDDLTLIRPLLSEGYEINPFPNEPRQTPIDFEVPVSEQYVMVLTLPEGYRFDVVPEDITVTLPNRGAVFMYKTKVINQHIQLLSRITINQAVFAPEQYDQVRLFFQHIASKHGEQIIVKKI